jgi:anti-sigma factor RsiW
MAGVSDGDIAALADGVLPPNRRAQVEAAVAASPELARKLAVQRRVAATIRVAAARVRAPDRVRGNPVDCGRP